MNTKPLTQKLWSLASWKTKPISQQPVYPCQQELENELNKIKHLPPIVNPKEIDTLASKLADAYNGKEFVLQLGDCAELFADCNHKTIEKKAIFFELMGKVFEELSGRKVTIIGRIGGQYAKPRTDSHEVIDGEKVVSFKGENIHDYDPKNRTPDPKRLTEGYFRSVSTVNYLRQLNQNDVLCKTFSQKVDKYLKHHEVNIEGLNLVSTQQIINLSHNVYTSHEALLLPFEEALTRETDEGSFYALSAHFLWIGFRTCFLDGAHVEFFRGLENPVGIKVGKDLIVDEESVANLITMIKLLNPLNREGKIVLITRLGARNVETYLPKIIEAVKNEGLKIVWFCDGVHGNTQKINGTKTRKIDDVQGEILSTLKILKSYDLSLHGVHLEATPDEATECIGGKLDEITEQDLDKNYTSLCDPRLNFYQTLELVSKVASEL